MGWGGAGSIYNCVLLTNLKIFIYIIPVEVQSKRAHNQSMVEISGTQMRPLSPVRGGATWDRLRPSQANHIIVADSARVTPPPRGHLMASCARVSAVTVD